MRNTRKPFIALLAVALVAALGIGATVAWLTADTTQVKNTFTIGDINITLDEAPVDKNGQVTAGARVKANSYEIVPGSTYSKDPIVTVKANSEECYLFVVFNENAAAKKYLTYVSELTSTEGWKQLTSESTMNVWYREVPASTADQAWHLLDGDKITVNGETVTKATMAEAKDAELSWDACAVQKANLTVEQAWAQAKATMNA